MMIWKTMIRTPHDHTATVEDTKKARGITKKGHRVPAGKGHHNRRPLVDGTTNQRSRQSEGEITANRQVGTKPSKVGTISPSRLLKSLLVGTVGKPQAGTVAKQRVGTPLLCQRRLGRRPLHPNHRHRLGRRPLRPNHRHRLGRRPLRPNNRHLVGKNRLRPKRKHLVGRSPRRPRLSHLIGRRPRRPSRKDRVGKHPVRPSRKRRVGKPLVHRSRKRRVGKPPVRRSRKRRAGKRPVRRNRRFRPGNSLDQLKIGIPVRAAINTAPPAATLGTVHLLPSSRARTVHRRISSHLPRTTNRACNHSTLRINTASQRVATISSQSTVRHRHHHIRLITNRKDNSRCRPTMATAPPRQLKIALLRSRVTEVVMHTVAIQMAMVREATITTTAMKVR
jgi:hypothetical protein